MQIKQQLFEGPIDVIGDIHGEFSSLLALLIRLGYDVYGHHPEGRRVVFLGDLVDRGHDSVGVLLLVQDWVARGKAQCVMGNHEFNILTNDVKAGAHWWFEARAAKDIGEYGPCAVAPAHLRPELYAFLDSLPLLLENEKLTVTHACPDREALTQLAQYSAATVSCAAFSVASYLEATGADLFAAAKADELRFHAEIEDPNYAMRDIPSITAHELFKNQNNPFKRILCGPEQAAEVPFFAMGKWRFTDRLNWWEQHTEFKRVVFGHYWRDANHTPHQWLGPMQNAFCLDFSCGKQYRNRVRGEQTHLPLAALRFSTDQSRVESLHFHTGFVHKY